MRNLRKDFYNNDFLNFITDNKTFFEKYKKRFVLTFIEYLKKISKKNIKNANSMIEKFYERLFISPFLEDKIVTLKKELQLAFILKKYNIDISVILNRLFLLMSNAYIKEVLKEKKSIYKLKTITFLCSFYIEYISYHLNSFVEEDAYALPQEIIELYLLKKDINLFSIYKGIPIAHKTKILGVDEKNGTIRVSANKYQIVAAKFHKEVFLLENDKEYSYRANIIHCIPHAKEIILSHIEKKQRNAPKRNYIRVQPKEEVDVTIKKENETINAKLYDLSLKGMCVIANQKLNLEISDSINLEFSIHHNNKYQNIKAEGEIKSITKINEDTYKYHIQFETGPHYELILERYITQREKEIIKELNNYIQKEFISLKD